MDPPTDPEAYDVLVDRVAADATERAATDGADDALWAAVTEVVPELTADVCEAILDQSEHEPLTDLVEEVTAERDSDDAERRRARAITVLLQDAEERLA